MRPSTRTDRVAAAGTGAWRGRALCQQVDQELFFPEKGGSPKDAKRVCLACEVRVECLAYALDNGEPYGVWGGLSERERRRRLARQRGPAAPAAPASGVAS